MVAPADPKTPRSLSSGRDEARQGRFREDPAQASATARPSCEPLCARESRTGRRWGGVSGTLAGPPGRAAPSRKAAFSRVARSPQAVPDAPLGRGEGRPHAGVQTRPWGLQWKGGCAHFLARCFLPFPNHFSTSYCQALCWALELLIQPSFIHSFPTRLLNLQMCQALF